MLGHPGFSVQRIVSHMYLTTEGLFGMPLGGLLRLPVHPVRCLPAQHRSGQVLHRPGPGRCRPLRGRPRQGGRAGQWFLRYHFRFFRGQYGVHGYLHHPAHEERGLSRCLCRRRGSRLVHRWPDHAAHHGGRRLHHGPVPGRRLRGDRQGGPGARPAVLPGRGLHGAYGSQAPGPQGHPQGTPAPHLGGAASGWLPADPHHRADLHADAGLHAAQGRLLLHRDHRGHLPGGGKLEDLAWCPLQQ